MIYSVVICSYNKLPYIKLVVGSLASIGGDHQYILSDDGSTDGTVEWAGESGFFSDIVAKERNEGYGLCAVRNSGIRLATNEHVVLLDADCMPEKEYFDGHDEIFGEFPNSLSVGFTNFYDETGNNLLWPDHRSCWLSGQRSITMKWMDAYGGNISFPRRIWDEVGGFDESYDGAWGLEDADFAYMAVKKGAEIHASAKSRVRHLRHPVTGTVEMRAGRGPNTKKFIDKHGFSPC